MSKIKLFCLPYAGGSSTIIYSKWKKKLNRHIELIPIELAGRGIRIGEPFYKDFSEAIDDIYDFISNKIESSNEYAIFGYSMGSWLAYELANKIKEFKQKKPMHIFIAAKEAPNVDKKDRITMHNLPNWRFKEEIEKLGGTPEEIVNNNELFELFSDVLRADYRIIEDYAFKNKTLESDITVMYGDSDNIKYNEIMPWGNLTTKKCILKKFLGGHFFIHDNLDQIVNIINLSLVDRKEI